MSILFENDNCALISHEKCIKTIYRPLKYEFKPSLFAINKPFKKQSLRSSAKNLNNNEALIRDSAYIQAKYVQFLRKLRENNLIKALEKHRDEDFESTNQTSEAINDCIGGNSHSNPLIVNLNKEDYLIPNECKFYAKDVNDIAGFLTEEKFNLIILDPPWWNKAIRRKRLKLNNGYSMMNNNDIKKIPLAQLLSENGIVVVWCTNSKQHINELQGEIFKEWKVELIAEWFWLKITSNTEPIINFCEPPAKQPFERILIATNNKDNLHLFKDKKLIISIPSLIHSHKPPLIELLKSFIKEDSRCLEIFARYLLPGWTSYGLEVLRLQNKRLYTKYNI